MGSAVDHFPQIPMKVALTVIEMSRQVSRWDRRYCPARRTRGGKTPCRFRCGRRGPGCTGSCTCRRHRRRSRRLSPGSIRRRRWRSSGSRPGSRGTAWRARRSSAARAGRSRRRTGPTSSSPILAQLRLAVMIVPPSSAPPSGGGMRILDPPSCGQESATDGLHWLREVGSHTLVVSGEAGVAGAAAGASPVIAVQAASHGAAAAAPLARAAAARAGRVQRRGGVVLHRVAGRGAVAAGPGDAARILSEADRLAAETVGGLGAGIAALAHVGAEAGEAAEYTVAGGTVTAGVAQIAALDGDAAPAHAARRPVGAGCC